MWKSLPRTMKEENWKDESLVRSNLRNSGSTPVTLFPFRICYPSCNVTHNFWLTHRYKFTVWSDRPGNERKRSPSQWNSIALRYAHLLSERSGIQSPRRVESILVIFLFSTPTPVHQEV